MLNLLALLVKTKQYLVFFIEALEPHLPLLAPIGAQFSCVTGTKVQILTPKALLAARYSIHSHYW